MSANTAKQSNAIDRPFAAKHLKQARKLTDKYQIILKYENGDWFGRSLEMPGVMADGKTPDQCVAQTREAMIGIVAYMLEQGQTPPAPSPKKTTLRANKYSHLSAKRRIYKTNKKFDTDDMPNWFIWLCAALLGFLPITALVVAGLWRAFKYVLNHI